MEVSLAPNLPRFRGPRIEAVVSNVMYRIGLALCNEIVLFRLLTFRVESHVFAAKSLKASEGKLS